MIIPSQNRNSVNYGTSFGRFRGVKCKQISKMKDFQSFYVSNKEDMLKSLKCIRGKEWFKAFCEKFHDVKLEYLLDEWGFGATEHWGRNLKINVLYRNKSKGFINRLARVFGRDWQSINIFNMSGTRPDIAEKMRNTLRSHPDNYLSETKYVDYKTRRNEVKRAQIESIKNTRKTRKQRIRESIAEFKKQLSKGKQIEKRNKELKKEWNKLSK